LVAPAEPPPAPSAPLQPSRPPLPPVASAAELKSALERLDIPERELRQLLEVDRGRSDAFAPEVVAKRELVAAPGPARSGDDRFAESAPVALIESLNTIARWRRQRAYAAKIKAGWSGLRFVAHG